MSPTNTNDDDDTPLTYYEIELRKRLNPAVGEEKGEAVQKYPRLPQGNPWSEPLAPEPLIDRRCDGGNGPIEGE
jgi:hypothetical protein